MNIVKTLPLVILLFFLSCYPVPVREDVAKKDLKNGEKVTVPTKIHMLDGSVILCHKGFMYSKDIIYAEGEKYSLGQTVGSTYRVWIVALDSVLGIEYYDKTVSPGRALGSILLGAPFIVAGAAILAVAVFGSCPTVYSVNENSEELEAEGFSYSIGRKFEMGDLDRMNCRPNSTGIVNLKVRNEALETHYINQLRLCYVDHPKGTQAYPTDSRDVLIVSNTISPLSAVNSEGTDITELIRQSGDQFYQNDSATASRMYRNGLRDWIDCTIPTSRGADEVTVILRLRNSLLTTILFYEVMMKSQGADVFQWMDDVNNSSLYAWRLGKWYKEFSGIRVSVKEDGSFEEKGKVFNAGPIAWKYVALKIPVGHSEPQTTIRLNFLVDNWQIDWIGFSFDAKKADELRYAEFGRAEDIKGFEQSDVIRKLQSDDDDYVVTYPGDYFNLSFALPPQEEHERTLFIAAKGYYSEWMRPQWLRAGLEDPHPFTTSAPEEAVRRAAQIWIVKKNKFEKEFFASKIPSLTIGDAK
jgi:hypothetical protein